jgi:hypothetical protein
VARGGNARGGLRRHEATAEATCGCKSWEVTEVHRRLRPVPWPRPSDCMDGGATVAKRPCRVAAYLNPSVDCTRELSASYNGNQRGPSTAVVTLVTHPSDFSMSVEPR